MRTVVGVTRMESSVAVTRGGRKPRFALGQPPVRSADFQRRFNEPLQPALRVGYRLVPRDALIGELEQGIAVVQAHRLGGLLPDEVQLGTADELFDRFRAMRPEVWPPEPGALLRPVSNLLFVDLVGATRLDCRRASSDRSSQAARSTSGLTISRPRSKRP